MDLDHIFTHHVPTPEKIKIYETLRPAFKQYAEALISEKVLDEDNELVMELAYDEITRHVNELVPYETPEYDRVLELIDQAYNIARDPNRAVTLLVQGASMYANAAVALEK